MTRTRFCAECGKTDVPLYENFCQDCYYKFHKLGKLKKDKVELAYCLTCGSVKLTSGWTGPNYKEEIPQVIAYAHFNNISTSPVVMIDVENITPVRWENPNPEFIVTYALKSDQIPEFDLQTQYLDFEVKINGGTCKTCVKKKTGSGDVVVQFRAKNRSITKEEQDTATTIAFEHVADMSYESPEAYINDIVHNYGGLDFYFGNNAVAEAFILSIKKQWIGHYEKNYKLITEDKDEKKIYAVTHLFRLPEVKLGDLVNWKNELHVVHHISKAGIHLKSLVNHSRDLTKNWEELKPVDPFPKLVKKLVVSEQIKENSYMLMDLESYETEEVARDRFPRHLPLSEEVVLLQWKDKYYLEPKLYDKPEDLT